MENEFYEEGYWRAKKGEIKSVALELDSINTAIKVLKRYDLPSVKELETLAMGYGNYLARIKAEFEEYYPTPEGA